MQYAIREKFGGEYVSGHEDGRWTPASNEARLFDSREEAEEYAEEHVGRAWVVVEMDE